MKPASPWAELDRVMAATAEPTGPEWFTAYEFAARYKLTHQQAAHRLKDKVRVGAVTKWTGTGVGPAGKRVTITKFKLTTK